MNIFVGVGAPGSVGPTSGGKVYAYNGLGTSPTVVAPANVARTTITFHNPGAADMVVFPALAFSSATASAPTTLTPTTANLGGGIKVFAGTTVVISGECQGQWQALALTGLNPLTVLDSNV